MAVKPAAFLTYVRLDDEYEDGRLSEFRERLSREVRMQTGDAFPIFQDRNDIRWGENWRKRIEESIDGSTFLIPILTPSFFKSVECKRELTKFLARERQLGRSDLILPVYYVSCAVLDDHARRARNRLATELARRQFVDWRELRFEPFTSATVRKSLSQLGKQICEALARVGNAGKPLGGKTSTPRPRARRSPAAATTPESPGRRAESTEGMTTGQKAEGRPVAAKTEPPTLVVDPLHRGDHATIADAIAAANAGDRILVRPGLYEEGLVVDKPLEIIGEGECSEIVVRAEGQDAMLFQTTIGRVTNLTLRQAGDGEWYGVDIAQGRLELEGCDISSAALACVAIHSGADPRLRRNRIHDGAEAGVYVYENGQGTLEDNDIYGNGLVGVATASGGTPTLLRNRIHHGKAGGVYFYDNAQGTLEENDIFDNAYSGVEIKTGSNPTLRRNRIHDGKAGGVYVHEDGRGTLEDNDIVANASSGVAVASGGHPVMRGNRVNRNGHFAVHVSHGGAGTFEHNDLRENAHGAWSVAEDCEVTVNDNLE